MAESQTPPGKRSGVELVKETSRYLRGKIVTELNDGTDHVSKDSYNLLKFHGTYQQEDRDARKNRAATGISKFYMFMVRCKIPGGKLSADQYLAMDQLAGKYANGTLRFTTRQGIQFHGVIKNNLHATIHAINESLLTTLGACGDVTRNVMCTPAPIKDGIIDELQRVADAIAAQFAPRSRSYHEIWLNGMPVTEQSGEGDSEPIYGKTYLPRKFKIGLTQPEDNCVDIFAQDLGFVAIIENRRIVGYNVLVGGGMGMTHGNANTFPFLAKPICYVAADDVMRAAEAVIKLYRDHGNRADRKRARIKYVLAEWGVPRFKQVLETYFGGPLEAPRPVEVEPMDLHLGWRPQGDGRWYYGVSIENGRVKDEGTLKLRSALRTLVGRFQPTLRITPNQDLLLCDLPADARAELEATLRDHGVAPPEALSLVRTHSMACPAIPTCGLALSESERTLPGLIDQFEVLLKELGLEKDVLTVRMTGCPNGCARPYQSDIGIVGRSGDKYTIFVGGRLLGDRLNFPLRDLVPSSQILPLLRPLLQRYQRERKGAEGFGEFCTRLGPVEVQTGLPPVGVLSAAEGSAE